MRSVRWIAMATVIMSVMGCGYFDSHVKQMDLLNGLAAQTSSRLKDGSVASIHASGQGIEPGIATRVSITYGAEAYFKGMAGQFSMASHGELGREYAEEQAWAIMRDKSLNDEQRRAALERLFARLLPMEPPASRPSPPG